MSPEDFGAISGGTLAVLGIIAGLWKTIVAAHRAAKRIEHIETLAHELQHNGGGSIKDAVHRIETKVDANTDLLSTHTTRIARNEGKIEALALVSQPTPPPATLFESPPAEDV